MTISIVETQQIIANRTPSGGFLLQFDWLFTTEKIMAILASKISAQK